MVLALFHIANGTVNAVGLVEITLIISPEWIFPKEECKDKHD